MCPSARTVSLSRALRSVATPMAAGPRTPQPIAFFAVSDLPWYAVICGQTLFRTPPPVLVRWSMAQAHMLLRFSWKAQYRAFSYVQ